MPWLTECPLPRRVAAETKGLPTPREQAAQQIRDGAGSRHILRARVVERASNIFSACPFCSICRGRCAHQRPVSEGDPETYRRSPKTPRRSWIPSLWTASPPTHASSSNTFGGAMPATPPPMPARRRRTRPPKTGRLQALPHRCSLLRSPMRRELARSWAELDAPCGPTAGQTRSHPLGQPPPFWPLPPPVPEPSACRRRRGGWLRSFVIAWMLRLAFWRLPPPMRRCQRPRSGSECRQRSYRL